MLIDRTVLSQESGLVQKPFVPVRCQITGDHPEPARLAHCASCGSAASASLQVREIQRGSILVHYTHALLHTELLLTVIPPVQVLLK